MHGTLGRSTSPPFPSLPLTPRPPEAGPRHCPHVYLQPAAGDECPRTPGPGESRLFPGHLRIVPLIFWKL